MVRSHGARRRVRAALLLSVAGLFWLVAAPMAHAQDELAAYNATVKVLQDGQLQVTATLDPSGSFPSTVTQRFATRERVLDNSERVFEVSNLKAVNGDTDLAAEVSQDGDYTVLSVPTGGLSGSVTLTYTVRGAALRQADGSTLVQWRVLQGLSAGVESVDVTVTSEAAVLEVDCVSGPPSAPSTCSWFQGGTHDTPDPTFHDGPRGAGEIVAPSVRYPGSSVAANETVVELWSLDRAFRPGLAELLTAFGLLVLGGAALYALHRRIGRDATSLEDPTVVASFRPVGAGASEFVVANDVRPGMVGTLLDERVDPVDVTASVLDLAVRGYLLITELPRESDYAPTDWTFTRTDRATDDLAPYESAILDAVAPAEGRLTVSEIGPAVVDAVPRIQSELYDEVVSRGWFAKRPDDTRSLWGRLGWIVLAVAAVATVVLVAFTTFGLVGLAIVLLALGLLFVAQEMPSRTAAGTSVLAGLRALQAELLTHPTDEAPAGREYEQLSRVLPYAVVLGGQDRWIRALVAADDDAGVADPTDLDWYHAPATWHLQDLPGSLRNLLTTLQGTLFSR
ncbi:DUF2207 domain-containing protein [Propionicicella superfundia]|uniref:DUF2207 domain-containing protein n=1 Tax=Propionicicella superfundia TaxID=348582 RepID=UPI0003F93DC2|nr:DUF2207 domain-containing protein [Propionicicella superfundia]